jgi:hypothetical protein
MSSKPTGQGTVSKEKKKTKQTSGMIPLKTRKEATKRCQYKLKFLSLDFLKLLTNMQLLNFKRFIFLKSPSILSPASYKSIKRKQQILSQ